MNPSMTKFIVVAIIVVTVIQMDGFLTKKGLEIKECHDLRHTLLLRIRSTTLTFRVLSTQGHHKKQPQTLKPDRNNI